MTLKEAELELGLTGLEFLARNYLDISKLVHERMGSDSLTRLGIQVQIADEVVNTVRHCYELTQQKLPEEYSNLKRLADKMYNELERVLVVK